MFELVVALPYRFGSTLIAAIQIDPCRRVWFIGIGTENQQMQGRYCLRPSCFSSKQPFVMTEGCRVWKLENENNTYNMPAALADCHWTTAATNDITSNKMVMGNAFHRFQNNHARAA